MAKSDITGKRKLKAQNVSHSNIKTKRWQNLNIQTRRVWVPEAGRFVTLNLTTRGRELLDEIARECGYSRADVVEHLLRYFGQQVHMLPRKDTFT